MLRKRPLKPLTRRWRIDQRIEKDSPIAVRQNERLMLRDRPPGSVCERRHAEIRQLAPFKPRRALNEGFGGLIDAKPESLFSKTPVALCCRGHGYLHPLYVRQTD
jgi:hypothetical protein